MKGQAWWEMGCTAVAEVFAPGLSAVVLVKARRAAEQTGMPMQGVVHDRAHFDLHALGSAVTVVSHNVLAAQRMQAYASTLQ